jgi:hypothetical protein
VRALTLALGAVVATSALVYLNPASESEEADLVAPRPQRATAVEKVETTPQPGVEPSTGDTVKPISSESETTTPGRDRHASFAKTNLFRMLETPPVPVAVTAPAVADVAPVVTPKPTFVFLGSFKEGDQLQAIVQVGDRVEFVEPNQIVAGFRIDAVKPDALSWTHEPTSTKGLLQARGVK